METSTLCTQWPMNLVWKPHNISFWKKGSFTCMMELCLFHIGHDIVDVGEGEIVNYFHKGTSSVWQESLEDGPVADCSTGEGLDVMFYYLVSRST